MGIIKYFRKKYWEAAIFRGGRRIPFTCDGLTTVPDSAYALFTEKELEKIWEYPKVCVNLQTDVR